MNYWVERYHRMDTDPFAEQAKALCVWCPACEQPPRWSCVTALGIPRAIVHEARIELARKEIE